MKLPKIDLDSLPDLDTVTGLFGSFGVTGGGSDDTVVAIMVYVYEVVNPDRLF